MKLEILIMYSIYKNSSYSHHNSSLTEFSESFINEEIRNIKENNISKLNFEKSINNLEESDFLVRSSKHHLTTLNSWRITEKTQKEFSEISKNDEINLNLFKKFAD
jgi:arsenate reductase-like glutaredoxin family protein